VTKQNSTIARILRQATHRLYRSASIIVTIGRDMQSLVRTKAKREENDRIRFIPNWADEDIQPKDRRQVELLRETKLNDRFVIGYAGNIGAPNDFETLLEAAEDLAEHRDVAFLILGSGSREAFVRSEIQGRGLSNVVMVGSRPRSEQSDFLGAADLALISLRRGMVGVSMPSRTYNTMASKRPILAICEPESELWRVVNDERIGWTVAPGDVDALVAAILHARQDLRLCSEMAARARNVALSRYSRTAVLDQWRMLFRELAEERRS
jgi:glycosyltransferase involved in cell wall biosynthesis